MIQPISRPSNSTANVAQCLLNRSDMVFVRNGAASAAKYQDKFLLKHLEIRSFS
jgi:hypothetical protein